MENWFNAMANKQTIKELIADDNKFYYICLDCGKTTNKLNKDGECEFENEGGN